VTDDLVLTSPGGIITTLSGISVFLPCYNEEGNLGNVVAALTPELSKLTDRFEIIIVNDGSSDHTGEIADALAGANPSVRVVHHRKNQGYGAAVY
jgi:glycosyltransferase involved in cell wall biosynthesis